MVRSRRVERLLRRVLVGMVVALTGLLGGVLVWPALRTAYYTHRAHDPDPAVRVAAINVLGALSVRDPDVAGRLVEAVLAERTEGTPTSRDAADRIAVWTLERSPAVRNEMGRRLADADDGLFLHIAGLLRRAGYWRRPERSLAELAKRETLRMIAPDPASRVAALDSLAALGPDVGPFIAGRVVEWLDDASPDVREAVIRTASICLDGNGLRAVLEAALTDTAPGVRRESVIRSALAGINTPLALVGDAEPVVQLAAVWALGFRSQARCVPPLWWAFRRSTAEVRAMAAWSIGRQGSAAEYLPDDFAESAIATDPVLAARTVVALGRLGRADRAYDVLERLVAHESAAVSQAAIFAIGTLSRASEDRKRALPFLRQLVEESLRDGQPARAAVAFEALARLGDQPFAPVMGDVAREFVDQPMLQLTAATCAVTLDRPIGASALLVLLDGDADAVCDLAARRLGTMANPPVEQLTELLAADDERVRASAALALGFAGAADAPVDGQRFDEWLRRRTDRASGVYESAWKPHGYYLCARVLLGDAAARDALDPFIRNENFPRLGLYAALLHVGDTLPMDLLLTRESNVDVESFLRDARFIEVIRERFPNAPSFDWFEDEDLRRWQVDRLRDWWSIQRRREQRTEN